VSLASPVSSFPSEWNQFDEIVQDKGGLTAHLDARDRYWDLTMKLKDSPDTFVDEEGPADSVLSYSPDSAPLILHLNSPEMILSRHSALSRIPVMTQEVSALLSNLAQRDDIHSMSLTLTRTNSGDSPRIIPLVVLRTKTIQSLNRELRQMAGRSTSQIDSGPDMSMAVGSTRFYMRTTDSDILLSTDTGTLTRALQRWRAGAGVPQSIGGDSLVKKLNDPYRAFVYMNSSPLTDRFELPDGMNPSNRKLITLLFGFNPAHELGQVVSGLPATVSFVRTGQSDELTEITLTTAGDVFVPFLVGNFFPPRPGQSELPGLSNYSFSKDDWLNSLR
jgi:hypothetical protein